MEAQKKMPIVLENEINDNNKPNKQLEEDEITTRELVTQLIEVMKTSGNTYIIQQIIQQTIIILI